LSAAIPQRLRRACVIALRTGVRFWGMLFPDRIFRRSMTFSCALHAAVLLIASVFPVWQRQPSWPRTPIVVSLVRFPDTPTSDAPAAPAQRPQPPPQAPPEKPKDQPKQKPKPQVVPTPEPAASRERESAPQIEKPPVQPAAQPPAQTTPAVEATAPVQLTARVDETQFTYDYYLQNVAAKISAVWQPPAGVEMPGGISATLRFRILRTGAVQSLEVETASSAVLFDRSAADAVRRAQPLPPLPPGYGGRWLTLHLRFASGN